jgi:UDP-N-acetylglucosamine 4-epimerase
MTSIAKPQAFEAVQEELRRHPRRWLVTGAGGFIGSHLVEALLGLDQQVTGLDNFSTGYRKNLDQVLASASEEQRRRFTFIEGDLRNAEICRSACQGQDVVLHQAALGSVPRSMEEPWNSHDSNVNGFLQILLAVKECEVPRLVYASSSSVYGDAPELPKREEHQGNLLSPYALTKRMNEELGDLFFRVYGVASLGFRYFNVFGPRQDPQGAYAAVIPRWFKALWKGEIPKIYGDGETSRDFCYVKNVVQINLLGALTENPQALNKAYNVAVGERTTLNQLFTLLRDQVARFNPQGASAEPEYEDFRPGDIRHSLADISQARELLGYEPQYDLCRGLEEAASWYAEHLI